METTTSKQLWFEINNLKKRLAAVEQQAAQLKPSDEFSPEEEFRREFPNMKIDRKWFRLVGILPPVPVDEDRNEIIRAIEEAYGE